MAGRPAGGLGFHGDWNYTLHPQPDHALPDPAEQAQAPLPERWDRDSLAHPTLTGMSPTALAALTADLDALRQAHWRDKQREHQQGLRRHAPRSGRPPSLTFHERVLATILHRRLALPADILAVLLHTNHNTIRRALRDIRQLLDEHATTIPPAPAATAAVAHQLATAGRTATTKVKPAS